MIELDWFDRKYPFLTYWIGLVLFWCISFILFLNYGYEGSFIIINQFHHSWLDPIFMMITLLGDGSFLALFVILYTRTHQWKGFMLTIASLISTGLIIQFLKRVVFDSMMRPGGVFTIEEFHCTENPVPVMFSFPSGHATSIASVCTVLALLYNNKKGVSLILAQIVVLVSYSRIYLGVHFLMDVVVGSMIGAFISLLLYKVTYSSLKKVDVMINHKPIIQTLLIIISSLIFCLVILNQIVNRFH